MSIAGELGLWELEDGILAACSHYEKDGFFMQHDVYFAKRIATELVSAKREHDSALVPDE